MAGTGFKLQLLLDRDTLGSRSAAYATGVAATSALWIVTTVVLFSIRALGAPAETAPVGRVLALACVATSILCAPIEIVVSRYAADRLYDGELGRLAAPLRRTLAVVLAMLFSAGAAGAAWLTERVDLAVAGGLVSAILGAEWLLVALAAGLTSPTLPARALAAGGAVSLVAALALGRFAGLGAPGFLAGFALGQLCAAALLLQATLRALPGAEDEEARILPAFARYRTLALAALASYAAMWADKLVVWLTRPHDLARAYVALSSVAWFAMIPTFALIYVRLETGFQRRYAAFFYRISARATLGELREAARALGAECAQMALSVVALHCAVIAVSVCAAPRILAAFGLPAALVGTFRLALFGTLVHALVALALLFLYYLDLRTSALAVALVHLGATIVCSDLLPLGAGYAAACGITALVAAECLRRGLGRLLVATFQSQPYGHA